MGGCARLLLLAALPALAGWVEGEVVGRVSPGAGPQLGGRPAALLAAAGRSATLHCRVLRLGDKAVSWVRTRDLQILAHAGAVFTADARVSSRAVGADHELTIAHLRPDDSGRYECQLNTEPKMSLFYNLTVVDEPVPVVVVEASAARVEGVEGGAAQLECEAQYRPPPARLPLPPLDVTWYKGDQPLDLQSARGGVSLDTSRWSDRCVSRLTLGALRQGDQGLYRCRAAGAEATLRLALTDHTQDEAINAMQRDESGVVRAGGPGARASLLLALGAALVASRAAAWGR